MTPCRIQRSRKKGSKLPPGTVCVTRPGPFGNPFIIYPLDGWYVSLDGYEPVIQFRGTDARDRAARAAVMLFRGYASIRLRVEPNWLEPIRGKSLACWCAIGSPCHADVLLELANREK